MSNTPHQTFLVHPLLKDFLPLRLPSFSEHALCDLAAFIDARRILMIKHVYDLVRRHERLVLKRRVAGQRLRDLAQRLEVPKQVPSFLIWHDEHRRIQRKVSVHVRWGDCTPLHAKHPVASGFDDEFKVSGLASFQRDDVLYASVTPKSAGDPV